jgi:hypothetical protein
MFVFPEQVAVGWVGWVVIAGAAFTVFAITLENNVLHPLLVTAAR